MKLPSFSLQTLLKMVSVVVVWLAFARWHIGWGLFLLTLLPLLIIVMGAIKTRRLGVRQIALLLLCTIAIYPYSIPPLEGILNRTVDDVGLETQIWNAYVLPLKHFHETTVGNKLLPLMLNGYFEIWNKREGLHLDLDR